MWGVQVLLVNAFILYRSAHTLIWKTDKKNILGQYEFRRSIALEWIGGRDPQDTRSCHTERKRQAEDISVSQTSSITTSSDAKARKVTDAALDPQKGALRFRLDETLFHFPEMSKVERPCCSLCRRAEPNKNIRTYSHVYNCDKCGVALCVPCFRPFHKISSIAMLKSRITKTTSY